MRLGHRLALLGLVLLEVAVVIAAVRWLGIYFRAPHIAPDDPTVLHGAFSSLYPEAEMPFEILQIALSLLVGSLAIGGAAGKNKSVRRLVKLLPVAGLAAVLLGVLDINGLYSYHGLLQSLTERMHGAFSTSVARVNDTILHNGLIWMLSWTTVRLAAYAVVYLYVGWPLARSGPATAEP